MTETKFTKGPWSLNISDNWPWDIVINPNVASLGRVAHSTVQKSIDDVRCAAGFPHNEREHVSSLVLEQEANAHLIAAAPELYEALRELLLALGDIRGFEYEDYLSPEVIAARAALAKARGEL